MGEKKYGIMGGTFDPIHLGHLILAEEARNFFKLDKVIFIPTGNPPHKIGNNICPSIHRYMMTLLATINNPYFSVSNIEIKREGITYSIDTLKVLKQEYKDVEFYFIIGADSLNQIFKWRSVDELFLLCKFIVARREGIHSKDIENKIKDIQNKYGKVLYMLSTPYINISSTDIRKRIKQGKSIKYYVTENVENYIKKNKLYL